VSVSAVEREVLPLADLIQRLGDGNTLGAGASNAALG
jgi:hypothetical protein